MGYKERPDGTSESVVKDVISLIRVLPGKPGTGEPRKARPSQPIGFDHGPGAFQWPQSSRKKLLLLGTRYRYRHPSNISEIDSPNRDALSMTNHPPLKTRRREALPYIGDLRAADRKSGCILCDIRAIEAWWYDCKPPHVAANGHQQVSWTKRRTPVFLGYFRRC